MAPRGRKSRGHPRTKTRARSPRAAPAYSRAARGKHGSEQAASAARGCFTPRMAGRRGRWPRPRSAMIPPARAFSHWRFQTRCTESRSAAITCSRRTPSGTIAITADGGKSWIVPSGAQPAGYRSAVIVPRFGCLRRHRDFRFRFLFRWRQELERVQQRRLQRHQPRIRRRDQRPHRYFIASAPR